MVYTKSKASKKKMRKRNNITKRNKTKKRRNIKNRNKITKRKKRIKNNNKNNYSRYNGNKLNNIIVKGGGSPERVNLFLKSLHEMEEPNSSKKRAISLADMRNLKLAGIGKGELYKIEQKYYETLLDHITRFVNSREGIDEDVVDGLIARTSKLLQSLEEGERKRMLEARVEEQRRRVLEARLARNLPSPPDVPLHPEGRTPPPLPSGSERTPPPPPEGSVPVMDSGGDKPMEYFDFKEYQTLITSYICLLLVEGELIGNTNEWEKCNSNCIRILKGLVDKETSMTFYWIKYLNACLIKSSDSSKIEITCDDSTLTGLWDEDKYKLNIVVKSDEGVNNINGVIPVIGPSASGKTVWVLNLVKSLGKGGQELIKRIYRERGVSEPYLAGVLNIDGGIMREMTDVGRAIVDCLRSQERLNIGISNYHGNIFNTDDIKVKLIDFLSNVHRVYQSEFMVALPDTATSISKVGAVGPNFISYMLTTLGISGFTTFIPICFYVYQHIKGGNCKFKDLPFIEGRIREGGFRCVGCTESGKRREIEEGKKYDSGHWHYKYLSAHRFAQDIISFLENNTICLKIHNSGRRVERLEDGTMSGYSIITIRSPEDKIGLVNKFLNKLREDMDFFIMLTDGSITPPP
tara:strand:- start:4051 stop:5952 length:1902 start_codon:yes stop_codon:yes gene_type:complete